MLIRWFEGGYICDLINNKWSVSFCQTIIWLLYLNKSIIGLYCLNAQVLSNCSSQLCIMLSKQYYDGPECRHESVTNGAVIHVDNILMFV